MYDKMTVVSSLKCVVGEIYPKLIFSKQYIKAVAQAQHLSRTIKMRLILFYQKHFV